MTDKLLLEVWMDKGKMDEVRLYRGFVKEAYIVNRLQAVCNGLKKNAINTATGNRLMKNGEVKLGKGIYTVYLYHKDNYPHEVKAHEQYLLSQLPTFVEYILAMRERYYPDLDAVKEIFKGKIDDAYAVEYLARALEDVQIAETQVIMWDKLIGQKWSVVNRFVEEIKDSYSSGSVALQREVMKYIDKLCDDIIIQTSFGAASSTSQSANVFENLKHETVAKWYREHAKEIQSLKEGENYR